MPGESKCSDSLYCSDSVSDGHLKLMSYPADPNCYQGYSGDNLIRDFFFIMNRGGEEVIKSMSW